MLAKLGAILKTKIFKVMIFLFVIGGIIGGLFYFKVIDLSKKSTTVANQRWENARLRDIKVAISGSGSISSVNRADLTSSVQGKVIKVNYKVGDKVKQGDLLYELDDSDGQLNLEKAKNAIAQQQITINQNNKNISNLKLKAPFDGIVTNITPNVGDVQQKNANVLTITDTSSLKLIIPFNGSYINDIKKGMTATVKLPDLMSQVEGVVSYSSSNTYVSTSNLSVFDVELTIANTGTLRSDLLATAEFNINGNTVAGTESKKMTYFKTEVLKTDAGGTIKAINTRANEFVKAGNVLVEYVNEDLMVSSSTANLKMEELKNTLDTVTKQLDNYKIIAPSEGTIITQSVNIGDTLKASSALCTLLDEGHLEFTVSIDELDIAKIKQGQKANISVDALPETTKTPYIGEIYKIAQEATPSNGVTVYPVTIRIENPDKLKAGMNAHAEIVIEEVKNVLTIPIEAVNTRSGRSTVYVAGTGNAFSNGGAFGGQGRVQSQKPNQSSEPTKSMGARERIQRENQGQNQGQSQGQSQNNFTRNMSQNPAMVEMMKYYENTSIKQVEIGISNDQYVEIKSGLEEGEKVLLPQLAVANQTNSTQTNQRSGMGGMGGIGGIGGGGNFNQNQGNRGNSGANFGNQGGNSSGANNRNSSGGNNR